MIAHSFEQALLAELRRLVPLQNANSVEPVDLLVGLSGGADSTALLAGCCALRDAGVWPARVRAVHVDHNLQHDSSNWAKHCQQLCETLQVDLHIASVEVAPGNVEAQARAARYAAFEANLESGEWLLLAHHATDQTETLLMRLFSGRGLLPMRNLAQFGRGWLARPLLPLNGREFRAYLGDRAITWVEDVSNQNQNLDRNFLRHSLLPSSRERWPQLDQGVQRVAAHVQAYETLVRQQAHRALWHDTPSPAETGAGVLLLQDVLAGGVTWVRELLAALGVFEVGDAQIDAFLQGLASGQRATLLSDQGVGLCGHGAFVYRVHRRGLLKEAMRPLAAKDKCAVVATDVGELRIQMGQLSGPVLVDGRQGGEKIQVSADQSPVAVKDVLYETQVLPWWRDAYPLVKVSDQVVCVPGLAQDFRFAGDTFRMAFEPEICGQIFAQK